MAQTTYIEIEGQRVKKLPARSGKRTNAGQQHVFVIGSKGIPARYGGFETFAEKLTRYRKSSRIRYHVARMAEDSLRYEYNEAECFDIKTPPIGAARAVWYDIAALRAGIRWCREHPEVRRPVFYVLACRIGPWIGGFKKRIKQLGGRLYVNPDGHEWKRRKWNRLIRCYWKWSERLMAKHADQMVCDSVCIQKYIKTEYARYGVKTVYIAYGGDDDMNSAAGKGACAARGGRDAAEEKAAAEEKSAADKKSAAEEKAAAEEKGAADKKFAEWLAKTRTTAKGYYLAVGRLVPENNAQIMIREFMASDTKRDFVILSTPNAPFLKKLEKKLHFSRDRRIKFAEAVYDAGLLKKIRENACGYFHGHEVGGTNPSLLEALASTEVNLLLDVKFNREVAGVGALYWTKEAGNLADRIAAADRMSLEETRAIGERARRRIAKAYRWEEIVRRYETLFLKGSAPGSTDQSADGIKMGDGRDAAGYPAGQASCGAVRAVSGRIGGV